MTECYVSNQIADYCNQPEQLSADDLLHELIIGDEIFVSGESYDLAEITDKIDIEEMREAVQASLLDDRTSVRKLYIKVIEGLME